MRKRVKGVAHPPVLNFKAGTTKREEVLSALEGLYTGVGGPTYFWARWDESRWGFAGAMGGMSQGVGGAATTNRRLWRQRNFLASFDRDGVVKNFRICQDDELLRCIDQTIEEAALTDRAEPVMLEFERRRRIGTPAEVRYEVTREQIRYVDLKRGVPAAIVRGARLEAGAEGAWRFTQRIWRLVNDSAAHAGGSDAAASLELRRAAHKALAAVTDDLSSLRFNRAIARIYELANALGAALSTLGLSHGDAAGLPPFGQRIELDIAGGLAQLQLDFGMPRASIGTGMVDWVLRVADMPARIRRYYANEDQLRLPPEDGPQPAKPAATGAASPQRIRWSSAAPAAMKSPRKSKAPRTPRNRTRC